MALNRKGWWYAVPFFAWLIVMLILSTIDLGGWARWREYSLLFHFFAYFLLLSLFYGWQLAINKLSWKKIYLYCLIGMGLAGLDEWHQQFVPSRYMELQDWLCDIAGLMIAAILASLIYFFIGKEKRNV